ncbi:MAG: hypothetical protein R3350_10340 [Saprospiraceae bacterium]|nr:hypothetical protein [Saprospiraceae bacterium]
MKIPVLRLLIGLSLFLNACQLAKPEDPILVVDVEKEFLVDMWEKLEGDARFFQLPIQTVKEEDCLNYGIDVHLERSSRRLDLSFNDIVKPEDCIPGTGPASASVDFGSLTLGYYEISFSLKETIVNKGRLIIGADYYELDIESENGLSFLHEKLHRVPKSMLWGRISYADPQTEETARALYSDLSAIAAPPLALNPGYYGHFTIGENLSVREVKVSDSFPQKEHAMDFILDFRNGEFEKLKDVLDRYRSEYGEQLYIFAKNGRGELF